MVQEDAPRCDKDSCRRGDPAAPLAWMGLSTSLGGNEPRRTSLLPGEGAALAAPCPSTCTHAPPHLTQPESPGRGPRPPLPLPPFRLFPAIVLTWPHLQTLNSSPRGSSPLPARLPWGLASKADLRAPLKPTATLAQVVWPPRAHKLTCPHLAPTPPSSAPKQAGQAHLPISWLWSSALLNTPSPFSSALLALAQAPPFLLQVAFPDHPIKEASATCPSTPLRDRKPPAQGHEAIELGERRTS